MIAVGFPESRPVFLHEFDTGDPLGAFPVQLHLARRAVNPPISKRQVSRSIGGGPLAPKMGHFLVRDWPGGIRSARRASGLTITSGGRPSGEGTSSPCVLL
jgi:hypothetical protein